MLDGIGGNHEKEIMSESAAAGGGDMLKWLRDIPPFSEEQLKAVCITSQDFTVSSV